MGSVTINPQAVSAATLSESHEPRNASLGFVNARRVGERAFARTTARAVIWRARKKRVLASFWASARPAPAGWQLARSLLKSG
jgi:hypothetical protein